MDWLPETWYKLDQGRSVFSLQNLKKVPMEIEYLLKMEWQRNIIVIISFRYPDEISTRNSNFEYQS